MLAITKASFRAILRTPSAVVFSIFFPLIFILDFGVIGNSGGPSYRVGVGTGSDTSNQMLERPRTIENVCFCSYDIPEEL